MQIGSAKCARGGDKESRRPGEKMPASPSVTLLVSPFPCLLVWCDATARPRAFRQSYLILLPARATPSDRDCASRRRPRRPTGSPSTTTTRLSRSALAARHQARPGRFRVPGLDARVPGDRQQSVGRFPDDRALRSVAAQGLGCVLPAGNVVAEPCELRGGSRSAGPGPRAGNVSLFRQARSGWRSGTRPV